MSTISKFVLLGCMVFLSLNATAQLSSNAKITDVKVQYQNDMVYVPYNLNGSQSDRFFVWVEFFNESNEPLSAKSLSGDVNFVDGAGSKVVKWDLKGDGFILNESITARVHAKQKPEASIGKAFAYSTLFPGVGQYQYVHNKPYWLSGAVAYSLIGGSAGSYAISHNAYNQYISGGLPHSEDPNFKKAQQFNQISLIMAGAGLAVWLLDYAGIISKSSKHKRITPQQFIASSDYREYSATSPAGFISTRGLPPNLFADLEFVDDNQNGILESREGAILKITLSNEGGGDAMLLDVDVSLDEEDENLIIKDGKHSINLLKSGEQQELLIPIAASFDIKTKTHKLKIDVSEHYGYDMDPAYLILNSYAYQPPQLVYSGYEIIDSGPGTMAIKPDGQLQAGEQVRALVVVQNIGLGTAYNAIYSINTTDPNIFIDDMSGVIGDIKPGEVKKIYFTLSPNRRVETKDNLPIFLTVNDGDNTQSIQDMQLSIALDQTPPIPNIVEVESDLDALKPKIARFESTSDKFRVNIANVVDIADVTPSQTRRSNSLGVVIGVENYRELPSAPYADNDARIMREYFEKVLGVEQIIMFTNEQVSGFIFDDIFNPEIGELGKAIIPNVSEVFVYYSGHGLPDKDGRNVFLFPSDGRISRLETQGLNIEKLYEHLSAIGAKHVTVILDACFSGSSRTSAKIDIENLIGQRGIRVRPRNTWFNDPNFTVISSSTNEETSLGFDDTQTGLFTYFLAAGLRGEADANNDGVITLGELREYVTRNVIDASSRIFGQQTPVFHGDDSRVMTTY